MASKITVDAVDVDGNADAIVLDGDGDTTISAPADDQIDFEVGGTDVVVLDRATGLRSVVNIVLDDGSGDSPQIQFVGGSNDDTVTIFLDDDAGGAGESDLVIQLAGAGLASASCIFKESGGANLWTIISNGLHSVNGYLRIDGGLTAVIIDAERQTSITNTITTVQQLSHTTDDTAAAEFGGRLLLKLEDDGGAEENAAAMDWIWDDAAAASEDSRIAFSIREGGAALAEAVRIDGGGIDLVSGKDVYPEGDGGGLFQRAPNHWRTPTDHFNSDPNYTWAAYAHFDDAPSTEDFATFPSIYLVQDNTADDDHYGYAAGSAGIYCRLTKGPSCEAGIRIQDHDDDNEDYAELKLIDGTTAGTFALYYAADVGGGAFVDGTLIDNMPAAFYLIRLMKSGNNIYCYIAMDSPYPLLVTTIGGMTWTMARAGILYSQGAATGGTRVGLYDFVEIS